MPKPSIEGTYSFRIFREGKRYYAECRIHNQRPTYVTQGRSQREIFEMMADLYLTLCTLETNDQLLDIMLAKGFIKLLKRNKRPKKASRVRIPESWE